MGRHDAVKGIHSPKRRHGRKNSSSRKRRRTSPRFRNKRSNARRGKKKYNLDNSSSDDYSMTMSDTDSNDDSHNNDRDDDRDDDDDNDNDDEDGKNVNKNKKEQEEDAREKDGRKQNIKFDPSVVDDVTNPPDPSNLRDHYTDAHRVAFESKFFGNKLRGNEVCKSREERDIIFDVVKKWNGFKDKEKEGQLTEDEEKDFLKLRQSNHLAYDWIKKYSTHSITLPNGTVKNILRRLELDKDADTKGQKKVGRSVACMEECFEIIHEAHRLRGHLGVERTWTTLSPKYFNITQKMVRTYCATCHICMEKNPIITGFKGAKKPILSHSWRDRFQMDLIDLRKFPRKNIYGITMRWLLTVKDHSTGLTAVFAIPRKMAKYVVYELEKYFGLVGYPTIFHTDNGNEFTAKIIIDMLKLINPSILTVTGRPRTPRDQGSIEQTNKTIKRMLSDLLAD